jgi:2-dehydropantoate 2-reductase
VGGFFGGKLAYYLESRRVASPRIHFVARGEHLEAIRSRGLLLHTVENHDMVCRPATASDGMEDMPAPDLCLLCVKSYDLDDALSEVRGHMREQAAILPLLNGADIYERIRARLTYGAVLPACAYVGAHVEAVGVVKQTGGGGIILCGNDPNRSGFDPAPLIDLFDKAGIDFRWRPDPFPAIWEKFIFIAGYGLVTAATGMTLGKVLEDDRALASTRKIMEEISAIARVRKIPLAHDIVDASLEKARQFPPETKTSFQRDIEIKGKRNEGDLFGGTVLRLGDALGIPTPETAAVYWRIQASRGE